MTRYKVTLSEEVSYEIGVTAHSEAEAIENTQKRFLSSDNIGEFPCKVHSRVVADVEQY